MMYTKPMSNGYEINEKDIDAVINYLKIYDPNNATPEMAIAFLEHFQAAFHKLSHTDPEKLKELFEEFKSQKKTEN